MLRILLAASLVTGSSGLECINHGSFSEDPISKVSWFCYTCTFVTTKHSCLDTEKKIVNMKFGRFIEAYNREVYCSKILIFFVGYVQGRAKMCHRISRTEYNGLQRMYTEQPLCKYE